MNEFSINTNKKKEVIDITKSVEQLVKEKGERDGVMYLFVTHTTAALTTADLDPGTDLDMLDAFEHMMPKLQYRHPHDPDHAPDHILSSIIGPSLTVLIRNGELVLGTWQRIVLIELDGPRERTIAYTFGG